MWTRIDGGFRLIRIAGFSTVAFVLLLSVAIKFYPGGTRFRPEAPLHYSYMTNAFSDLGRVYAFTGQRNLISISLFVLATAAAGLSVATVIPGILIREGAPARFTGAMTALASIAALGFAGVGLTPFDLFPNAHGVSTNIAFGAFAVLLIAMACWSWSNGSRFTFWTSTAFTLLLVAYNALLWVPALGPLGNGVFGIVAQKLIVLAAIAWIASQAMWYWRREVAHKSRIT